MCGYFARFVLALLPEVLSATAARTSALNAPASTFSPSWMSIARLVFPPRLELKSLAGSFNDAPLAKVSFTTDLYVSPVQMLPSCDHVGVPGLVALTHFTSSTTAGSACLMSLRIRLRVSPRQPPVSAIPLSISSDADWSSVVLDFFMFSSTRPDSSRINTLVARGSPATGEAVDGEAREHDEDARAPHEAEDDPVGGGVTDAGGVGAAEGQAADGVADDGERLVVGEGLHPARQRVSRHVGARDEGEWDDEQRGRALGGLGAAGEEAEADEDPHEAVGRDQRQSQRKQDGARVGVEPESHREGHADGDDHAPAGKRGVGEGTPEHHGGGGDGQRAEPVVNSGRGVLGYSGWGGHPDPQDHGHEESRHEEGDIAYAGAGADRAADDEPEHGQEQGALGSAAAE